MSEFSFAIHAGWAVDAETPATIGAKSIHTLDMLGELGATFQGWYVVDAAERSIPLGETRGQITKLVEDHVSRDDFGFAQPNEGYTVWATTCDAPNVPLDRSMNMMITAGAVRGNKLTLKAGWYLADPDPAMVTYGAFRSALVMMGAIWPCPWLNAYVFSDSYWTTSPVPGAPPFPYSLFHMAWMSYLSAPLAKGLAPPPELIAEPTPGGGMLLIAAEERLDPSDPEHLRRSHMLADIMIERAGGSDKPARSGPY